MDRAVKIDPIIKTEPAVKILLALIAVALIAVALIAVALIANMLRPALTPAPAQAAPVSGAAGLPAVAMDPNSATDLALVVQDGVLYRVDYGNNAPEITGRVRLK
jgi:hypothetical protein